MTDTVCPMFGDVCGYHSKVYMTRPYTQIWKNPKTKMFEPAGLGRSIVDIDDFCNNHPIGSSGRISEMHYCPKRWALYRGGVKVEKMKKRKCVRKEKVVTEKKVVKKKIPTKRKIKK